MTDRHLDDSDLKERLWKEIEKVRYGMLGLMSVTPPQHFQPMTAFCEPETGDIWFFTRDDTELARTVGQGGDAMFVVQAKDQQYQACIGGRLTQQRDSARIEKYWNPVVSAWYPAGKGDARLTLLRLQAADARIWLSEAGNPLTFGFQIAKANMTRREPDVGESHDLDLRPGR